MAELYSLSKVSVIITNPTFGQIIIADGGNKDSIEIRRTNEGFTKEDSADGPSVFTHNASKAGESEIILKQTSRFIPDLTNFYNFCQAHPELAASTMEIKDVFGVVNTRLEDMFPNKLADNSIGQTAGTRSFGYICNKLDMQEA
ncbi:DUF3277 family protein [Candidatus Babeliales bacterium]|nr:DUF3277 family protein [Candidatus Babeliales bacterium]